MRRLLITRALLLGLASTSLDGTVACHTYNDAELKRLVTICSDGSRAVTRYDAELQRWNTQVITPQDRQAPAGLAGPRKGATLRRIPL